MFCIHLTLFPYLFTYLLVFRVTMAGNKMNTKSKGKEDRNKSNTKGIGQTNEEADETDFALLRKPIPTSITGFGQARKIYDLATEEVSIHTFIILL